MLVSKSKTCFKCLRRVVTRSVASKIPVLLVDSFSHKPFGGNPAAVVFNQGSAAWMQSLASELNVPVTAFVDRATSADHARLIRWFTPTKELTICGHATLAAAHTILNSTGSTRAEDHQLSDDRRAVTFHSEYCGMMTATKSSNGAIQFSFPCESLTATDLNQADLDSLTSALAIEPTDILYTGRTSGDLIVEVTRASFARIGRIVDHDKLATLSDRGVIVTCVGKSRVPPGEKDTYHCVSCGGHPYMLDQSYDYLLRGFFPRLGLPEDHATGSAQCSLAPYYFARFELSTNSSEGDIANLTSLRAYQASKRGGVLQVAVVNGDMSRSDTCGDGGEGSGAVETKSSTVGMAQRVIIAGHCVTVMRGELVI